AGARDVGKKAMTFAEQNVANSFAFAQKLVRARDVQEVLRLHSEFIREQMETLSNQAKELGDAASRAATDAGTTRGSGSGTRSRWLRPDAVLQCDRVSHLREPSDFLHITHLPRLAPRPTRLAAGLSPLATGNQQQFPPVERPLGLARARGPSDEAGFC